MIEARIFFFEQGRQLSFSPTFHSRQPYQPPRKPVSLYPPEGREAARICSMSSCVRVLGVDSLHCLDNQYDEQPAVQTLSRAPWCIRPLHSLFANRWELTSTPTTKQFLTTAALSEFDRGKLMFQKPDQTRDKARPIDEHCLANPILNVTPIT